MFATWFICEVFDVTCLLSVLAAVFNWEWFFQTSNARMLTGKMPRLYARIIYFVIGCLILLMDSVVLREALAL